MNRAVPSSVARRDLLESVDSSADRTPVAAERMRERFLAAVKMPARRPARGPCATRPGATEFHVRFWPIGRDGVVYGAAAHGIEVVRSLNGYRDIAAILS